MPPNQRPGPEVSSPLRHGLVRGRQEGVEMFDVPDKEPARWILQNENGPS